MRRGLIGHQVKVLHRAERSVAIQTVKLARGTVLVSDCFQDIIARAYAADRPVTNIVNLPQLALFIAAFRTLRSSYNVFWQGYYPEAFGSLRSVLENVCLLGAYAHGRVPECDLSGDEPARKRALNAMVVKSTKITDADRKELSEFHDNLCVQVHGSGISRVFLTTGTMRGERYPSVEPYFDAAIVGLYANASANVMWSLLRVWTTMPDRPSNERWQTEYAALDAALRSLVVRQDNPLAAAMGKWIEGELDFREIPPRLPKSDVKHTVRLVPKAQF